MSTPNRLSSEKSLYLRQHQTNPVDWYPWGDEALTRARTEGKPILLSVGYSACHWCHVMAHESFENDAIAAMMNESYVCIKVDREERPDIDHIYQSVAQIMGIRGGWPLTVFMTAEGAPFYVGTYFPPEDRHGRPGFPRILKYLSDTYAKENQRVVEASQGVRDALKAFMAGSKPEDVETLAWPKVKERLWADFDTTHGGFGSAPKFPHSVTYEALFRLQPDPSERDRLFFGLRKMAQGGIYDHVGGGFHRYSTDDLWLVPHFEKMLYDNALLPRPYLDSLLFDGADAPFESVVRETLAYVLREMTAPEGFFFAAQDADSEGEEGKYFVWSLHEIEALARTVGVENLLPKLGVTQAGNFEGQTILHLPSGWLNPGETAKWKDLQKKLLETRKRRVAPGKDEKCLVSWNGLMIRTFVQAALTLGDASFLQAARRAYAAVSGRSRDVLPGVIYGSEIKASGMLDDFATMIDAALWLYRATGEYDYFSDAKKWTDFTLAHFWKDERGLFAMREKNHGLIADPIQTYDGAVPSGNGVMALNLLVLSKMTASTVYAKPLAKLVESQRAWAARMPAAYTTWILTLIGTESSVSACQAIVRGNGMGFETACNLYRKTALVPCVTVWCRSEDDLKEMDPLFTEQMKAHASKKETVFVLCGDGTCFPPVSNPDALAIEAAR